MHTLQDMKVIMRHDAPTHMESDVFNELMKLCFTVRIKRKAKRVWMRNDAVDRG